MARKIINTFDVADCNRALAEAGLETRIHMHDACGGQFFSWDSLGEKDPQVREAIAAFFRARGVELAFNEDASFVVCAKAPTKAEFIAEMGARYERMLDGHETEHNLVEI
ncbi:MAG: hypothetical protein Q4B45_08520 [Coriobacteriia bacterium]|nr:hypothetical protein [Coriobacteriia bacterium]